MRESAVIHSFKILDETHLRQSGKLLQIAIGLGHKLKKKNASEDKQKERLWAALLLMKIKSKSD
jgi:hypothetical protein